MANFLATWFYSSPAGEQIYYPGVGTNSDEWLFKKTYWHCILTFYDRLARIYPLLDSNSPKRLLFLNEPPPYEEISFQIDLRDFFSKRNVEIVFFDSKFKGVSSNNVFASQFHIYDVLRAGLPLLGDEDTLTLFDSDVLPLSPVDPTYFSDLLASNFSYYPLAWSKDHINNGVSLVEFLSSLKACAAFVSPCGKDHVASDLFERNPLFLGGELLGFTKNGLQVFLSRIHSLSEFALCDPQCKVTTEEQLNTITHFLLEKPFVNADSIIRRVWTDESKYRNVLPSDRSLPFVHLPAEKLYGFYRYYHEVILGFPGPEGLALSGAPNSEWLVSAFRI